MTKYFSQNPNGQTTMANSQPIVIASDQSEVPVNLPDVTSTDGATAPAQALVISGVTSGGVAQTVEVNASGHVNIADGGGSITVDGAVNATLAAETTKEIGVTRTADGSGNLINSIADGASVRGLAVAQSATNFVLSAAGANSTTTQLAASATFTGTIENVYNQQAISVLLTSDQNGTLTLNQYIDAAGLRKTNAYTFSVVANVPYSRSFVANGNYFNLTFQNTGASTTTTLNINTAYGTLPASTNKGNAPVSLDEVNGTAFALGQTTMAASLPVAIASNQMLTTNPTDNTSALPIRPTPQSIHRTTFADVKAAGFDTTYWTNLVTGSGMTISQTGGNGVITTGTTANAETITRSTESFKGSLTLRAKTTLSQRIINNNFFVELVDVIGDGLAITISSAVAVVVTIPSNPFTSANVGQSMYLGAYSGTGTFIPGRYAIASVSGNNVTFTVAGFAAGSGTCSAFGWNYHQLLYTSTTATAVNYDAQRNGWASGATAATINTTASPGHIAILNVENGISTLADALVASTTTTNSIVGRASRMENLPGDDTPLYVQIRAVNGSTAPASTTTWTLGFVSVEDYVPVQTSLTSIRTQSYSSVAPVVVQNTPAVTVSSGTITTVTGVTTVSTVTTNNNNIPNAITDVASAAITTTTTTAAFTPTSGSSYSVVIPVTAVTGTTPTMAVAIEESDDSGTNWYNRFTFATITTTGIYRSPILKLRGNRVRYVQTITGTTPSFTRSVLRLQRQNSDFSSVPGKLISAASTNATSVKPTPCEVTSISVANINAAARYLKIYDKASAPTVGTDTPIQTFLIPGATTGSGSNLQLNTPINFNLGFAFALTTGIADSDTGAVAANEIIVNYNVA